MHFFTLILFFACLTQAQIAVLNSQVNSSSTRIFLKNQGNKTLIFQSTSLNIKSFGVEGEWHSDMRLYVEKDNESTCQFDGIKTNYSQCSFFPYDSTILRPLDTAQLILSNFEDCHILNYCIVDSSVTPPDTLYKRNTAKNIDTLNVRLGLYWQDSTTRANDSTFIDCLLVFNRVINKYVIVGITRFKDSKQEGAPIPTPNGWRVATDAHWILVDAQGHAIPLRRETTADGLFLRTTTSQRGVGYLRDGTGKSYRVLMGM
jgi:hypothetical protein